MTVVGIAGLKTSLPRGKRLLGLDVGTKTIGLAIADPRQSIATPLDTIRRKRFTRPQKSAKNHGAGRQPGQLPII